MLEERGSICWKRRKKVLEREKGSKIVLEKGDRKCRKKDDESIRRERKKLLEKSVGKFG